MTEKMASKGVKAKKALAAASQNLSPLIKMEIKSQMATAAPPLGPMLGKRGINVAEFCKDFNKRTREIRAGVPLPAEITIRPDRTYDLKLSTPPNSWLLKQAAGIGRSKESKHEIVGWLSVKHIYEIAKIKSNDAFLIGVPLKEICEMLIQTAHELGIKVQYNDIDPEEYKQFLKERKPIVEEQLKRIEEAQTSKILRT